ncbi:MAG: hypothetical protein VW600_15225, partial [Ferrovibrio sp.]
LVELTVIRSAAEPAVARGFNPELGAKTALMERQPIVDRNGQILATNLKIASLYADPRKVQNPPGAATRLVQVLPELPVGEVQAKLASGKSFVWLKRGLTPREQYEVNRLGIPGLYFHNEQRRIYPQGALGVHVVGYTDIDGKGISGIEQHFDEQLKDPTRTGDPLELSIDGVFQRHRRWWHRHGHLYRRNHLAGQPAGFRPGRAGDSQQGLAVQPHHARRL